LIDTSTPDIGILGPGKRFDKMLVEYERNGVSLPMDRHQIIHSPIGLDIAAETPEEVEAIIVAEILAKLHKPDWQFQK